MKKLTKVLSRTFLRIAVCLLVACALCQAQQPKKAPDVIEEATTSLQGAEKDLADAKAELARLPEKYEQIIKEFAELKKQIALLDAEIELRIKKGVEAYAPRPRLKFIEREAKTYNATPRQCIEECARIGLRMATKDEILAWASGKKQRCASIWMIDSSNPDKVLGGYPMFEDRTDVKCGRKDTGERPRLEGLQLDEWDSSALRDCACAGVK